MKYAVKYGGLTIKEFDTRNEVDRFLSSRVYEWTEQGYGYSAYLGSDYLQLINDRGTVVTLTFANVVSEPEPITYNE